MSIIVYGPQGCGKTHHSQALRAHFKLSAVLDDHEPPLRGGVFELLQNPKYAPQVKALNALILTAERPPHFVMEIEPRRVLSFAQAMKQAGLKSDLPKAAKRAKAPANSTKEA